MNNLVKVGNENISVIEWKGQRVITTALLAKVYKTNENNVKNNFNNHKKNFIEGKHYFLLQGEDLREFKRVVNNIDIPVDNLKFTSQLYLWTKRGANRHCKILDTDKAWEQFDNLEEIYFKSEEHIQREMLDRLSDDELMAKALLVAQNKIAERDKIIAQQNEQIEEQKPLVDFAVHVSQSKDTIDMDEMAKIASGEHINIGRNRLIKWLKERKVLKDNRIPYQYFIDRGYFDVVEVEKETMYGTMVFPKTVITGKGQLWVMEKLRAEYC